VRSACALTMQCAVFPLQLLGFEVDPINSVQFSNQCVAGFYTKDGNGLTPCSCKASSLNLHLTALVTRHSRAMCVMGRT
jgi:pyridoxal/pyridoxine/pyridoxamine kinase